MSACPNRVVWAQTGVVLYVACLKTRHVTAMCYVVHALTSVLLLAAVYFIDQHHIILVVVDQCHSLRVSWYLWTEHPCGMPSLQRCFGMGG